MSMQPVKDHPNRKNMAKLGGDFICKLVDALTLNLAVVDNGYTLWIRGMHD